RPRPGVAIDGAARLCRADLYQVDEAVDRQSSHYRIGRRNVVILDAGRVQRVAPIDEHAVEHGIRLGGLFEQRGVAIDIAGGRGVGTLTFRFELAEINFLASIVDGLETGLAVAV